MVISALIASAPAMSSFFASLRPSTDFPHSEDFDDRYYLEGLGLYETQCVYLNNQQLLEQNLAHEGPFIVGEIGFGSAINFLAFFQLWTCGQRPKGPLIYISYEKFPMHPADLAKSLEPWLKNLKVPIERLLEQYKSPNPGLNLFFFGPEEIILILLIGEASEQLALCNFKANHWMLDGFAPAKNPSAWSESLLSEVARLAAPGASLATFTAASIVRRGLEAQGWLVTKLKGFGKKRHRLSAIFPGEKKSALNRAPMTIFGSGISGSSLAFFYDWLGYPAQIITCPGPAASAVPFIYAQFNPRQNWDPIQIFNVQTHQFSGSFFRELSNESYLNYGDAPVIAYTDLSPSMRQRFENAITDPRFSEILQKTREGFAFPVGFSLDGSLALKSLHTLSGTRPESMSFEQAHEIIAAEARLGNKVGIACSFTAPSLINQLPECSILRGQTSRDPFSAWSTPTHERYRFNPAPDKVFGATDIFVGFRSRHRSYLPLFGSLEAGQGVYSVYHGSKGFSSGPWCGLILALETCDLFSYKDLPGAQTVYSIKYPN